MWRVLSVWFPQIDPIKSLEVHVITWLTTSTDFDYVDGFESPYRILPDSHTRRYRSELCFMRIARTSIYLVIGDLIHGHIHIIMHYHYARVLILSRIIALSPLMLWNLFEDTQHILYPPCVNLSFERSRSLELNICYIPLHVSICSNEYKYMLHTFGPILVYACFPPGIKWSSR